MKPFAFLLVTAALAYGVELKYDDGSYEGLVNWDIQCAGVVFDVSNFISEDSLALSSVAFWFGNEGAPWDADTVHVAIQATNSYGVPYGTLIRHEWITAESSGSTIWELSPAVEVPAFFIVMVYSSTWDEPLLCMDGNGPVDPYYHSRYKEDGTWHLDLNFNYAIRCYGEGVMDLETCTWASIKRCI